MGIISIQSTPSFVLDHVLEINIYHSERHFICEKRTIQIMSQMKVYRDQHTTPY